MNTESPADSPSPHPIGPVTVAGRRRRSIVIATVITLLMVGIGLYSVSGKRLEPEPAQVQSGVESQPGLPETPEHSSPAPAETPDQISPANLVGKWLKKGSIRREVQIRPDGTASMKVQLDYLTGLVYGRETNFELSWEYKNGVLSHKITSGTPQANVDRIVKDFGDSISYRVVRVSDDELVLEGLEGGGKPDRWIAVK